MNEMILELIKYGWTVEFYMYPNGNPVLYVYKGTADGWYRSRCWEDDKPLSDKLLLAGVWSSQDFSKEAKP